MKPRALVGLVASVALVGGCKPQAPDGGGGRGSAAATGSAAPVPLEPFVGTLTVDRVLGARNLVSPFDPWPTGFARLQALVGAPTRIEGTRHTWAVLEGGVCAFFYVTRDDGADFEMPGIIVGTVQTPTRAEAGGPAWTACLAAAGVAPATADDPRVPGPPTDGSAVALATFRSAVVPARARWEGQRVQVTAVLAAITTATSSGDTFVTAALVERPGDPVAPVTCLLPKHQTVPTTITAGTAVVATGTVKVDAWQALGGAGAATLVASLGDCTLARAPAK